MKAAFIQETGAPEKIHFAELPEPAVGELEVLVRVEAVAVNPVDTYIRSGQYKTELTFPFVIGRDMVGIVASFHSALTAVTGLLSKAKVASGETVFINGGSGNVGTAVIQMAKKLGARVATTAGNPDKVAWCKHVGADLVINYKTDNMRDSIHDFAPAGVDIYWDATKTPEPDLALSVMARRGRMLIMSGLAHTASLPIGQFYTKNCTIYGFTISDLSVEELSEAADHINGFLSSGSLISKIYETLPLSAAAEAHRLMESEDLFGKLILQVANSSVVESLG